MKFLLSKSNVTALLRGDENNFYKNPMLINHCKNLFITDGRIALIAENELPEEELADHIHNGLDSVIISTESFVSQNDIHSTWHSLIVDDNQVMSTMTGCVEKRVPFTRAASVPNIEKASPKGDIVFDIELSRSVLEKLIKAIPKEFEVLRLEFFNGRRDPVKISCWREGNVDKEPKITGLMAIRIKTYRLNDKEESDKKEPVWKEPKKKEPEKKEPEKKKPEKKPENK